MDSDMFYVAMKNSQEADNRQLNCNAGLLKPFYVFASGSKS